MQRRFMQNYGDDFDVLFGPAYKGIPLSCGDRHCIQRTVRKRNPLLL